mmetsp:Transcript_40359/g.96863  ORF Transcript_40359/g.96863 Transcript_40359/m.96863 type:complete len:200 (+) Transcript_40359:955-1554(+)
MVGRGSLDSPAVGWDEALDSSGHLASGKLLLLRLDPLGHRHRQHILIDRGVQIENLEHHLFALLVRCVGGVPFLPQELPRADEGRGLLELPADHRGPLIQLQGQITVRPNPLGESGVHDGFGGWADSDGLSHLRRAVSCDPRHLRGKTLHVVLLRLQRPLGNEQRKIRILHPQLLDLCVEPLLDLLPNEEGPWSQDVAA